MEKNKFKIKKFAPTFFPLISSTSKRKLFSVMSAEFPTVPSARIFATMGSVNKKSHKLSWKNTRKIQQKPKNLMRSNHT